jgi:hypothetical protein
MIDDYSTACEILVSPLQSNSLSCLSTQEALHAHYSQSPPFHRQVHDRTRGSKHAPTHDAWMLNILLHRLPTNSICSPTPLTATVEMPNTTPLPSGHQSASLKYKNDQSASRDYLDLGGAAKALGKFFFLLLSSLQTRLLASHLKDLAQPHH